MHHLIGLFSGPGSHLVLLAILLLLSHLVYNYCFNHVVPAVSSGSIIMAAGIFVLYCMPHQNYWLLLFMATSFEIFILWFYLAIGFMNAYLQDRLSFHRISDRLSIGTWVAGTAITVLMLDEMEHTLHGFIVFMEIAALLLWLIYFVIIIKWLFLNSYKKFHVPATGTVLLSAVSMQAISLMLDALFHDDIPIWIYQAIVLTGCVLYFIGLFFILRYFLCARIRHVVSIWPNVNCINYGAAAITGLAIMTLKVFSDWTMTVIWWWTAICFLIVELLEIIRLVVRVKIKGVVEGIWIYDTSQWARVFAFGSFYAFSFLYNEQFASNIIVSIVAHYGQYAVGALLLIELLLAISSAIMTKDKVSEHQS